MLIGPTGISLAVVVAVTIVLGFAAIMVQQSHRKLRQAEERCNATQASLDVAKRNLESFSDHAVRMYFPNAAITGSAWHYCASCSHGLLLSQGPKGERTCPNAKCKALIKHIFVSARELGTDNDAHYARHLLEAYGLPFKGYAQGALNGRRKGSGAFVSRMVDQTVIDSAQAKAQLES